LVAERGKAASVTTEEVDRMVALYLGTPVSRCERKYKIALGEFGGQ